MAKLTIYVPRAASDLERMILPRSGIVGTMQTEGRVLIDYEGNAYGAANMVTWADRVEHAAGRHVMRYPTVARLEVIAFDLVPVGVFDTDGRTVTVGHVDEVCRWLYTRSDALSTELAISSP